MGIPVYISRVPRVQDLPAVQHGCSVCRNVTPQRVQRRYVSSHVYLLPMVSSDTHHLYQCTVCGTVTDGPEPKGSPSKPFLHRFGCFVFVGLPVLGLIAYWAVDSAISKWQSQNRMAEEQAAAAEKARQEQAQREFMAIVNGAKTALDESKKKCFVPVNAALGSFPEALVDLKPKKPQNASALEGAGYVIVSKKGHIPIPDEKHFGKQACFLKLPKEVETAITVKMPDINVGYDATVAKAKQFTAEANAMTAPAVMVATEHVCPDKRNKCVGAAVWMSVPDKKILAVVRVEKPVEDGGRGKDTDALATLLRQETAKW
ncbi:MAG: hypothetical protein IPK82_24765 [Polyangiaceae bacterium]|nr:hypothetical protein [Polyangiaceae bacterium]